MNNLHDRAIIHLSKDPILHTLIQKYEPFVWTATGDLFYDLLDAIVSQQLSVKAAATIFGRFTDLMKKRSGEDKITPQSILETPDDELRAVGFSRGKVVYTKSLAQAIIEKSLDLERLPSLADEEVIAELIKVKGIGRWTAEMIMIFSLHRPDVFSVGDLGLRTAVSRLYGIERENLKAIEKLSEAWSPYRSFASRYLWKSLDNTPLDKKEASQERPQRKQ
jgi:DNA-3-methyladenine glycosylase II